MDTFSAALEFMVLGDVEVRVDGLPVSAGGPKQRALLAALLLERGGQVSVERLVDALWAGSPPETARKSVQVYVSGLRKAIGDGRIVTRGRGYELLVEQGELDLDHLDDLARAAADGPRAEAAATLARALDLVRGRPFANVELEDWAAREVDRVRDRVLDVTEQRIDADLAAGRHRELVPELECFADRHPYRERPLELLMLALYRSGRQADALDAYRRGAGRLRDELGLEPGRPLQQLEASILRQDDTLEPPSLPVGDPAARQRRGWRLATVGALAILAAAVAAGAVALTHGESTSLAGLPPGLALVSVKDGSLVAHIATTEITDPVEVVSDGSSFWVWSLQPFSLVQVDPATGQVGRRIASPFGGDAAFLPAGKSVWFAGQQDLARVDVGQGRVVDRFPIVGTKEVFGLSWLTRCAGSFWISINQEGIILRVAPATGAIQARLKLPFVWAVECGDGGLWAISHFGELRRIDPRTNRFVARAVVPPPHDYLAVGGGYAWTANEENGTLYKVDRFGRVVSTYETGDGARELSFDSGTVWVANQDVGTVTGVDAATGARRDFAFGHPVNKAAAVKGTLLVVLLPGKTFEDAIRALKGRVARLIVPTAMFDPPDPALAWNPWIHTVERATCAGLLRHSVGDGLKGDRLLPDLANTLPQVSADGLTYTFTVSPGRRFAPPSGAVVTAEAVRYSIERALSPKIATRTPGMRFLSDLVGQRPFSAGKAPRVSGVHVSGNEIAFTLLRPSDDFLERLTLPFFCTVPTDTPLVEGGVEPTAPPSAGPYFMSSRENSEYTILTPNPNYTGPLRARLDAIALREGISSEHAVARIRSGGWDGAILFDDLLAPGSLVARRAKASSGRYRTEELPVRGAAYPDGSGAIHGLFSARLGCEPTEGVFDLALLCLQDT